MAKSPAVPGRSGQKKDYFFQKISLDKICNRRQPSTRCISIKNFSMHAG